MKIFGAVRRARSTSANTAPGSTDKRRKGKTSDFGTQLKAKQKLKGYYANITERQFRRIYGEATRLRGDTSENLISLLERRLDALVLPREIRGDPLRLAPIHQPRPCVR